VTTRASDERTGLARWAPGLAALLRYDRACLPKDVAAGLSVAAVALPVGIAYSALVGMPPVAGIYASVFPLLAYAVFGTSRQLVVGPDAATCIMLAASLAGLAGGDQERHQALAPALTLATGLIYLLAGACRLGFVASFLSQPILIGYLNGIAVAILISQVPKLLGYPSAARDTPAQVVELASRVAATHLPTAALGLGLVLVLFLMRRLAPVLPAPLIALGAGILAVEGLGLDARGVAVIGPVPAGLPEIRLAMFDAATYGALLGDAAGIALIGFTGGVLTAKSFARRNGYSIDADRELFALGAANIVAGVAQGFAVTGADSRTAVNDAIGGRTQLVGVVAAGAMLLVLLALTGPLALVPQAALAAVVMVSALGLFDLRGLRELDRMSRVEWLLSHVTALGVVFLGVLPGVALAVVLSLLRLLVLASRPSHAVLGRVPGLRGFHSRADFPGAETVPSLVLYRFNGNVVFFNVEHFCDGLLEAVRRAGGPVEWVIVDASPISIIDVTALDRIRQLRLELAREGVTLGFARVRRQVWAQFNRRWVEGERRTISVPTFATLKAAIAAFRDRRAPEGGPRRVSGDPAD
jgi:high affinity sulfate transporter 1